MNKPNPDKCVHDYKKRGDKGWYCVRCGKHGVPVYTLDSLSRKKK